MRAELLEYAHPCVCFKCPRVRRQAQGAGVSAGRRVSRSIGSASTARIFNCVLPLATYRAVLKRG